MNKKQIRLTESDLKQIVKESVNRIVKESDELDANDWKARYLKNAHYPNEPVNMKDIENKVSWEAFDDNVNSLYGQRGCYDDDYASQAYADDPLSDFYGLENKNTYDLKGYLAKRKLNKLTKNESKDINKKLIKLTEGDLHNIVKESVNKAIKESYMDGSFNQIDLDCSARTADGINGELCAANLWFENNAIIVRWVDSNGSDSTSNLLEDNPEMIWEILKSIKN